MAQISIYVDEKTAVKFWQMGTEERTAIRKIAQETLKREINRVPEPEGSIERIESITTTED